MKQKLIYGFYACLIALFFISYKISYSFFSDTSSSTANVFSAATTFPTPTPTGVELIVSSPTPTPTPSTSPTSAPVANHIVISEVQITGGTLNTTDDFIELYNPTSASISLNGLRLVKRSGSSTLDTDIEVFTSSDSIASHGYYLWANSGYTTIAVTPDETSADGLAASNSVALINSTTSEVIDALSWNNAVQSYKEGTEFSPDPGAGQSMERKALSSSTATTMAILGTDETKGNGYDAGDNSTDFVLRLVSQPQNSTSGTETP